MTAVVSAARRSALLASTLVFAAVAVLAGGQAAHADAPAPQKLRWAGVKPDGTPDPVWDTRPGRDNFRVLDDGFRDTGKRGSFRDGDTVYFSDPAGGSVTVQGTVRPADAFFLSGGGYTLAGSGTIAGNGGIRVTNGELVIQNANSYTGRSDLAVTGTLTLGNDAALGAGTLSIEGGTLQPSGGVREVPNAIVINPLYQQEDPLEVKLAGDHQLRLTGPIRLGGRAPTYELNVTNSKKVTVEDQLTEEAGDTMVLKRGPGTLEVSGVASHSGSTWVKEGELRLDTAIIRDRVLVSDFEWLSGPRLTGFGTIGGYLTAVEGVLDPGLDDDTAGTFYVGGDLRMFHSRYAVDLHGPGSNDSITVDGPVVNLTDSDLGVRMHYNPQVGDSFTIIDHRGNGATTGPFGERWAEGAQIVVRGPAGLFVTMTITYRGGDGNDVVLTALSRERLSAGPPPTGDPVPA